MTEKNPTKIPASRNPLNEAAEEALLFTTRVFRGAIDLNDKAERAKIGLATSAIGTWARERQSMRAERRLNFSMATVLAHESGGKVSDAMHLTMPGDRALRGSLGAGKDNGA